MNLEVRILPIERASLNEYICEENFFYDEGIAGEIVNAIFAKLNSENLASCSLVCKTWNYIADSNFLWNSVINREIDQGDKLFFFGTSFRPRDCLKSSVLEKSHFLIGEKSLYMPGFPCFTIKSLGDILYPKNDMPGLEEIEDIPELEENT